MSIIKSITMSAKPIAVRGGRLRKRGGQVVSFAPCFSDLMAGASRVALGGVLILSGVAALSPNSAMAMDIDPRCEATDAAPATIVCSGPASTTGLDTQELIYVSDADTTITTAAGFGIDTSKTSSFGAAIDIFNDEDSNVSFTDANASKITGNGTGLLATSSGDGSIGISTNGTIDGGNAQYGQADDARWSAGIVAISSTAGDIAISVADTGAVKANAEVSDYDPEAVQDDDRDLENGTFDSLSQAGAVLAKQRGTGDLSLTNNGSLTSSATVNSNVSLAAEFNLYSNDIISSAISTAAFLQHEGLGALTVENYSDISSTASAILKNKIEAIDDGEDSSYVYENDVDVNIVASGINATHSGGIDTRANPIDTDLTIANAGNIDVNASAAGTVTFNAYYNGDNSVNGMVASNAVAATRTGGGDVNVSNTAAINSASDFDVNINFTTDGEDATDEYGLYNLNDDNAVNIMNASSAVLVTAFGEDDDAIQSTITINNSADATIDSTASIGSNISFSSADSALGNDVNIMNMSSAVIANMFDDGTVLINNDGTINGKAAFDGSVEIVAADTIQYSDVNVFTAATGISANHFNDGNMAINNQGTVTSEATFGSVGEDGDAINSINFAAGNEIYDTNANIALISTAIDAKRLGIGKLDILNASNGNIASTATAILGHQTEAPYDTEDGEDTTAVEDSVVNATIIASGISATHSGGIDTRAGFVDTSLNITNAGNINVNALADGNVSFDGYLNYDNAVNSLVVSTAVAATRFGGGDVSVSNTGSINSTSAFDADIAFTADELTTNPDYYDLNVSNEVNIDTLSSAVHVAAFGDENDTVKSNISIKNDENGSLNSTASFDGKIAFSSGANTVDNEVNVETKSSTVIANMFDNGAVLINNNGNINSKAAFTGSIEIQAADYAEYNDVNVDVTATGVTSEHNGAGTLTINNYGTISTEASLNSVDEAGDAIDSINIAADSFYENYTDVELESTAIDALHNDAGDLKILNASGGKIISKATLGSNTGSADSYDHADLYAIGINAGHSGTGDISIVNDGSIEASYSIAEGLQGEDSDVYAYGESFGISAYRTGNGKIDITNAGSISADDGIVAYHNGEGDIIVTATQDSVVNAEDDGIYAEYQNYSSEGGNILISNAGDITAGDDGLQAKHHSLGNITVANTGTITADDDGIDAYHYGEGKTTVTNAGVITAADNGIVARHYGLGDISVTNTGTITAKLDAADIEAGAKAYGIKADQTASGNISIVNDKTETATGSIIGSTAAIYAEVEDGTITITNNGTLANSSGKSDAVAIMAGANSYDASGSVTITNNGTLTGTINTVRSFEFEGEDFDVSLDDTVINNGTWNTVGGTNAFGAGIDSITNGEDGILQVANATFTGLDTLTNNGTLTLANGVAGDTLTTDGNVVLNEGGNLVLDVTSGGSDIVNADGIVTIAGGKVTVNHVGPRLTQGSVTLINADSISGGFDEDLVESTAFLDLTLTKMVAEEEGEGFVVADDDATSYDRLDLTVTQRKTFSAVARTANQTSVAKALESMTAPAPATFSRMATFAALPVGNEMLDEILYLPTEAAANDAYDQLSGEAHATLRSNLAEDSRLVRNSILNRLQNREGTAVWGEMFYGAGDLSQAKNRNTGNAERDAWGFILGADTNVAENVTLGLAASVINHDNEQQSRDSKLDAETINLMAYVGVESGNVRFKVGTGYAWSDVDTSRSVSFGRFSDKLNANYDASQFQAFAEVGYRLPLGNAYIEPVASIAYIDTTTDAFAEKGGLAALTAEKRSESTTVTNLGARFSSAKTGIFSVNGMAGWHHSFGKLIPTSIMAFDGSDSFAVDGAAQSRNAAVAQLEGKFDVGEATSISVGYDGMFGNAGDHHAAKVSVRVKF